MKRTFLIATFFLLYSFYSQAQEVGRLSLGVTAPKNAETAAQIHAKNIAGFNTMVDSVKKELSILELSMLREYTANLSKTDTFFVSILAKVNKALTKEALDSLKITGQTEALSNTTKQPVTKNAAEVCPAISTLKELKIEKSNDAEYTFTLTDTADNPVKSFKITQFNEQLFNDKFKSAIMGLCNGQIINKSDSDAIEEFYNKTLKSQNLYQRMLEASLEVNDEKVLAGVLRVSKVVPVDINDFLFKEEKKELQKSKAKTDESNNGTTYLPNNFTAPVSKSVKQNGFFVNSIAENENKWQITEFESTQTKANTYNMGEDDGSTGKLKLRHSKLIVHDIQIQFQDGFIENIKVIGHLEGNAAELKFENAYPIAFSTRKDYRRFQEIYIYERTKYATKRDKDSSCSFKLADLLHYDQNLQLNTKDYSPENHVLHQKITDSLTYINLYKEQTSKILEMKVFSDLKGIDGNEPNGLIQLEVSKKLNFLTMRWPVPDDGKKGYAKVNYGLFNYITPMFSMNKIEDKGKRLTPNYTGANYPDTNNANIHASTLDLFKRQLFTVGANVSVLTVDIPGLKSTVNFGAGLFWGRVLLEDTLRSKVDSSHFSAIKDNNINQFGANSFQFAPEISWQIFPDKRYGFTFSQKFINYRMHNSAIKQVKDSSNYLEYLKSLNGDRNKINEYTFKRWLGTSEIYAFYSPSENNKMFFRYRFNWDMGNIKNNFHQLQIGIATYLTHTKKKEDNK